MKKINFSILLFLGFLTSLCNSNYDKYDNYKYDENYRGHIRGEQRGQSPPLTFWDLLNRIFKYDYYDHTSEDYTNDDNQELNDYYGHQNLLALAPFPIAPLFNPPSPPPPLPQPGNYIFVC